MTGVPRHLHPEVVRRTLVSIAVLVGILVSGAVTAVGGRTIFGDPSRETQAR